METRSRLRVISEVGQSVMIIASASISLLLLIATFASRADETESSTMDALTTPDDGCRNSATATAGDQMWLVTELLPLEWEGRTSVDGVVELFGDEYFFVADGHQLPLTKTLISPAVCVPWDDPILDTDDEA